MRILPKSFDRLKKHHENVYEDENEFIFELGADNNLEDSPAAKLSPHKKNAKKKFKLRPKKFNVKNYKNLFEEKRESKLQFHLTCGEDHLFIDPLPPIMIVSS